MTIGIDLGTTNSLVACWTDDGSKIIPNILNSNLTPSVVSVDENGEIYIGQIAKERMITYPQFTASVFKRYMGTEKKFNLGKYIFTPEELSSFVIKSLKADAEAFLKQEVVEAVISVPAYFNDMQRKATKCAAELAGLKVERLISEPTAAAIAYGLHQEKSETKFLVFDLGGGTFDVSILELFEGIMEVKSIAGDNFLGGEDFTNVLVSYFIEQHNIDYKNLDFKECSMIKKQAEICKCTITEENKGKMSIVLDGKIFETVVTNIDFEKLVNHLLVKLRDPIERALRDAELLPGDLDAVILIGGATRMPVVRSVVSKMFGRIPHSNVDPDEAVAAGTAIQVALKEKNEAFKEVILTDVCPYTLGTEISRDVRGNGQYEAGHFFPIIERNTTIPVSKVERLYTIKNNQTKIVINVYQGESRKVENNIKLGEINIKVQPAPAEKQGIDVRYTYDINGILEVEVTNVKNGKKESIIIEKNKGNISEKEIEESLKKLKNLKIHPRDKTENKLLISKGERLYEESLGEVREYIARLIHRFEGILMTQDCNKIKRAAKEFETKLENIEREGYVE